MVIQTRQYTLADFEAIKALQENQDRLLELIDGEIVEKVVSQRHGYYVYRLMVLLGIYFEQHPIGYAGTEVTHRPHGDTSNERRPDISIYLTQTAPNDAPYQIGMPDICVEIKSPSNTLRELREKARFYLANGAKMVWNFYPDQRFIETYSVAEERVLLAEDTLTAEVLLPNFAVLVGDVFKLPVS